MKLYLQGKNAENGRPCGIGSNRTVTATITYKGIDTAYIDAEVLENGYRISIQRAGYNMEEIVNVQEILYTHIENKTGK